MTDEDVVRRAASMLGTDKVVSRGPYKGQKQPQWWVVIYGARAEATMRAVLPHMGKRRAGKIRELLALPNLSHMRGEV
jgi:hypothetical protein